MAGETITVQVEVRVEPTKWEIKSHGGLLIGDIDLGAPGSYHASCYMGQSKKGKPVEVWSASFPTLDQAVEEIIAEHYPKVAA